MKPELDVNTVTSQTSFQEPNPLKIKVSIILPKITTHPLHSTDSIDIDIKESKDSINIIGFLTKMEIFKLICNLNKYAL